MYVYVDVYNYEYVELTEFGRDFIADSYICYLYIAVWW